MAEGFINIFAHISGLRVRSRSGLAHLQEREVMVWTLEGVGGFGREAQYPLQTFLIDILKGH